MVKLIIFGTPQIATESDKKRLEIFTEELKKLIRGFGDLFPELGIGQEDIFIFFPADIMKEGLGEEIVIFVEGFPTKQQDIRDALAERITYIAVEHYRGSAIDCTVRVWAPDLRLPQDSHHSIQKRR